MAGCYSGRTVQYTPANIDSLRAAEAEFYNSLTKLAGESQREYRIADVKDAIEDLGIILDFGESLKSTGVGLSETYFVRDDNSCFIFPKKREMSFDEERRMVEFLGEGPGEYTIRRGETGYVVRNGEREKTFRGTLGLYIFFKSVERGQE